MKKLCLHPLFFLGLVIRLALIIGMAPLAVSEWYVPFLDTSISSLTLDPWSRWVAEGGALAAFPYGYAMWLSFLPITLAAKLIGVPLQYGYELTLLAFDFCLLITLHHLLPGRHRLLLAVYWLSPIVILASYVLGLDDLVPALLLALSIFFIRRVDLKIAGIFCAAAISAKLSMVVALPFVVIYLYNNKALRQRISKFLVGFVVCALILGVPFLFSSAGIQMLFGNPEMGKIYRVALNLGECFHLHSPTDLLGHAVLGLASPTSELRFVSSSHGNVLLVDRINDARLSGLVCLEHAFSCALSGNERANRHPIDRSFFCSVCTEYAHCYATSFFEWDEF